MAHFGLIANLLLCIALFLSARGESSPAPTPSPAPITVPAVDESALDRKTSPCDDFYQFACGGWIAKTEIPSDRPAWSRGLMEMTKRNEISLKEILEKKAAEHGEATDKDEKKLGDYYATCMDESKAETASLKTLKAEMALIDKMKTQKQIAQEIAHLQLGGSDILFNLGSMQDRVDSSKMIAGIEQGGLGLPDRDYYLKDEGKMPEIRKLYQNYIAKMFGLLGWGKKRAAKAADDILAFETSLAKPQISREDARDPKKTYHRLEKAGLLKLVPGFSWTDYFSALDYKGGDAMNVAWPDYFKALNEIVEKTPVRLLRIYFKWHLLSRAAPSMGKRFVDEQFQFTSKALTGQKEIPPRWRRCVRAVDNAMGEPLGREFIKIYFAGDSKETSQKMVREVEEAFGKNLEDLDWMDDDTRKAAQAKLHKIVNQIGYPDKWRDYEALKITRDSNLKNSLAAAEFNSRYDLSKIGKPVDRKEWYMSPPTVNAYYSTDNNQMVFPAGILETPFFEKGQPVPVNYGGIGIVMGHELTHGFDDEGRKFDGDGNMKEWWTPKVSEAYDKRSACIVEQYAKYSPIDDLHLNGKLTLGENIADQGGVRLSYAAFLKSGKADGDKIAGFTPKQQFFIGFAQAWCSKFRPEYARMLVTVDPHSPAKFRVNGSLSNLSAFADEFSCKEGKAMAPKKRCEVW